MFVSYFSPLAPAAMLLLGAFVLSFIFPLLPQHWQAQRGIQIFGAPGLVGLAVVAILGTRLTIGPVTANEGLELLSGWNFSTVESAAALSVRVDGLSFAFIVLTLLVLLTTGLAYAPVFSASNGKLHKNFPTDLQQKWGNLSVWLALGSAACALFVAANGPTIAFAVVAFDVFTVFYWLRRDQTDLSVARLFLGILTAGGLALAEINATLGGLSFGLALWLRLGVYPFIETTNLARTDEESPLYSALALTVGFYLVVSGVTGPLPAMILWLTVIVMLLSGVLTWLAEQRSTLLLRLATTEALLVLLAGPLNQEIATAYAIGLSLSLAALWVTPHLGQPQLSERAWPWPYLPAAGATLTLAGLPWLLAWSARSAIYQSLFLSEQLVIVMLVVLAEALALSGLVSYWLMIWRGIPQNGKQAAAAVIIMVPFLIPGLAPFILSTMTKTALSAADFGQPPGVFLAVAVVVAGALGLGYFRPQLMSRLKICAATLTELLNLTRLRPWSEDALSQSSKLVLRVEVFLQGQHYLGWALFTAVVGVLVILLGR